MPKLAGAKICSQVNFNRWDFNRKHLTSLSPFDLLSSFTLAGPFGLVLGTQWAQQPTPRFDARAISVVTQYPPQWSVIRKPL